MSLADDRPKSPSYRWQISPPAPLAFRQQHPDLALPVVQTLYSRGLTAPDQVQAFICDDPLSLLSDPFALHGMHQAVDQVRRALRQKHRIAVFGDFDADGVTGTALLTQVLRALGGQVIPYIPHRIHEGYGLNVAAVDQLVHQGARLLITVDCGISSVEEIAHARRRGLQVVITDHHHVPAQRPPAQAIVNPKQIDEPRPWTHLAGVGLAFKLAQALLRVEQRMPLSRSPQSVPLTERDLLDLVALGTVADLAPLTEENRALVRAGLAVLNERPRLGLRALIARAGLPAGKINAGHIAFQLGPRLNAAGRLDDARASLALLLCSDEQQAEALAAELDRRNRERQQLTEAAQEQARQEVLAEETLPYLLFITGEDYPAGVVGLVASRLTEEFYRPSVVVEVGPTQSRGSCRSIEGFHIAQALEACDDLLERHGGHAAAAGFTVRTANLNALRQRLQDRAARELADRELIPTLLIDGAVQLVDMAGDTYQQLQRLAPFGYGNRTPTFVTYGLTIQRRRTVGQDNAHLKLTVTDGTATWDAIGFRLGHRIDELPERVDLVYTLDINEWIGQGFLQLVVKDVRPAGAAPGAG